LSAKGRKKEKKKEYRENRARDTGYRQRNILPYPQCAIRHTHRDLVLMVSSRHWRRDAVAVRVMARRHWTSRAGYDYYPAAVPGMAGPVVNAAGKVDYQDSVDYCQN